jgi:hypothetical protein
MPDRRISRRYQLMLPIEVQVPNLKSAFHQTGRTHDLSSKGVCFSTSIALVPGSELDFVIAIPALMSGGSSVYLRGSGTVVWVGQRDKASHVAAMSIARSNIHRH